LSWWRTAAQTTTAPQQMDLSATIATGAVLPVTAPSLLALMVALADLAVLVVEVLLLVVPPQLVVLALVLRLWRV
jgi:hypothetical protein